jgi:hypothetical protein
MADALADLLRRCCVQVFGRSRGTGFFVAPGLVVTCAHVVGIDRAAGGSGVRVTWLGNTDEEAAVVQILPDADEDIALLAVAFESHPHVLLGTEVSRDENLLAVGFPDYGSGPQGDSVTAVYEGRTELPAADGSYFHKFKSANVVPGFSGGPLLNRRTGRVIGVLTETRGRTTDLGGWAIPAELLLSHLRGIREAQETYLKTDHDWEEARACDARKRQEDDPGQLLLKDTAAAAQEVASNSSVLPEIRDLLHSTFTDWTQGISALTANYNNRIEHYLAEYLGTPEHPVAFGGREAAIEKLNRWLDDPQASPYLFLAAPAGRGKSALLARWSQRLLQRSDLGVAFIPVSIRYETNLSSVVFATIAARLAQLHGESKAIPTDPNISVEIWQGIVLQYLERELDGGKRLLLVIDGADEAADWELSPILFPARPPRSLRVVVSARFTSEHPGVEDWVRQLGWDRGGLAVPMELDELTEEGVADILERLNFPAGLLADKGEFVKTLHHLSNGDPLLIQLYTRDLLKKAKAGMPLRADELKELPPGLEGYFKNWWKGQIELWGGAGPGGEEGVKNLLDILSCALGPLSQDDVEALEPELDRHEMEIVLSRLQRFVIGDGRNLGYAFSHSRLAEYFRDGLSRRRRREISERYLKWGAQTLKEVEDGGLRPEEASAYLVQYYYAHLAQSGAGLDERLALVSNAWRQSWEAFEGTYAGFLNDVNRVWQDAHKFDAEQSGRGRQADSLGDEVRCVLCQTSVNSLAGNIPPDLIVDLVEHNMWTPPQGIANAIAIPDHRRAALGLISLLPHIPPGQRRGILQKAILRAQSVDPSERDTQEFLAIPVLVAAHGYHDEALALVEELKYLNDVLTTVAEIGRHLEGERKREVLDDALRLYVRREDAVRDPKQERWRPVAVAGLTANLPQEERDVWLWKALEMVQQSFYTESMLPKMLSYFPAHLLQDALAVARQRAAQAEHDYNEGAAIHAAPVPFLPEPLREHAAVEAFAHGVAALRARFGQTHPVSQIIVDLSKTVPRALLPELFDAALGMKLEYWRAVTIAGMSSQLPEELAARAWEVAEQMKGGSARVIAMRGVVKALPPAERDRGLDRALEAAWATTNECLWAETLMQVAGQMSADSLRQAAAKVNGLTSTFAGETAARAITPNLWAHAGEEAERVAKSFDNPDARACGLLALLPLAADEALKERLARETLAAVSDIRYEWLRRRALETLVPLAPALLHGDLLAEAERFADPIMKYELLRTLVPFLSGAELDRLVASARGLASLQRRAQLLKEAALRLEPTRRAGVAEEILTYEAEETEETELQLCRVAAAELLATCGRVEEALATAKSLEQEWYQEQVIKAAGPHLTVPLFRECFRLIRVMEYSSTQSDTLSAIAAFLPAELIPEAVSLALEFRFEDDRAKTLIPIANRASELGRIQEAYDIALQIETSWGVEPALRGITPHLSPEQLKEAVNKIWTGTTRIWDDGFKEFAPALPPEIAERLFASLQKTEVGATEKRLRWLVTLITHVEPARQGEAAQSLLPRIQNLEETWVKNSLLENLAPYLPEQQQVHVLREAMRQQITSAQNRKGDSPRHAVLSMMAAYLPIYALDEALGAAQEQVEAGLVDEYVVGAIARRYADLGDKETAISLIEERITSPETRIAALRALRAHLPPSRYREVLEESHRFARNVGDQATLVAALSGLCDHLPAGARVTFEEEMLAFARAVADPIERAGTLGNIARRLSEPLRRTVINEALDTARQVNDPDGFRQSRLLESLPKMMAEAGCYDEAIGAAQTLSEARSQAAALKSIIPVLPESRLEAVIEYTRSVMFQMATLRFDLLLELALRFEEPRRTNLIREAVESASQAGVLFDVTYEFEKVAPYVTSEFVEEIFNCFAVGAPPAAQLSLLRALAEKFPERAVLQVLEAVPAIKTKDERENGWVTLAPLLAKFGHLDKVESLLGMMTLRELIARALIAVAPYTDDAWHDRALQAIANVSNGFTQGSFLSDLLPSLPDSKLEAMVETALNLEYSRPGSTVLAQIVPRVAPKRRIELIEIVLTRLRDEMKDRFLMFGNESPTELINIAPYLTTAEQFVSSFEVALIRPDETVLAALFDALSRMPLGIRYAVFYETARMLSTRRREDLLVNLSVAGGMLLEVGGIRAVERTTESITEVGKWWV